MPQLQSENLTDLEVEFLTRLAESPSSISFSSFRHGPDGEHLGSEVLRTLGSLRKRRLINYDYDNYPLPLGGGFSEFYLLTKRGENFILREKLV